MRELRHQISRAVLLSRGEHITASDLALPSQQSVNLETNLDLSANNITLDSVEKKLIENALKQAGGNISEAARHLGITRMAMRYRMEKHGILD